MDSLTSYKLDPPRGGAQCALVTITSKIDDVFVVEHVQHLSPSEAEAAKIALRQLLLLASRGGLKYLKRNAPWTDDISPAKARRCRSLGRSPTAPPSEPPAPE